MADGSNIQELIVKSFLAVLFIAAGLLILVIVVGVITQELDFQSTVLALGAIISGIITVLLAKGGGDK